MGYRIAFALAAVSLAAASAAHAAPDVDIRNAVARVTIIPEARSDVAVTVIQANGRLPLKVTTAGGVTTIDGGLAWRSPNCHAAFGKPSALVWGVGDIAYDDMPQVLIRTPRNVSVGATGAVFGVVGRGDNVSLSNGGCGDWTIADQTGALHLVLSGSGDVRAGSAESADLAMSGSADVALRTVRSGLSAVISGSGDVAAYSVSGALHARIGGSGDIAVHNGDVTDMDVAVSGSGDIKLGGVARTLTAVVSGSGDVTVGRVTGQVIKRVSGSGDVNAGR